MRMSIEEKKELDKWVEEEYPKSLERIKLSDPFHQIGKMLIGFGILSYIIHIIATINFLKIVSIIFLILGMSVEIFALIKYFKSLSNEN